MEEIKKINLHDYLDEVTIKKIRDHAKLYETVYDKKEFLKNVSPYEQKIILMNSQKPYEVLNYLDELDLKSSRLLLEQLNNDEIRSIIELFTSEDKKKFYATFSDLSLVNQFIIQDKNSSQHVENLSFERKVELIDSSDKETQEATSVIYESMPYEERVSAAEKVTDIDASYVLESTYVYKETQQEFDNTLDQQSTIESQEEIVEQVQEETVEIQEELQDVQENLKEQTQKDQQEIIDKKLEDPSIEVQDEQISMYDKATEVIENDSIILENFQQERNKCEQQEISNLINKVNQVTASVSTKTM